MTLYILQLQLHFTLTFTLYTLADQSIECKKKKKEKKMCAELFKIQNLEDLALLNSKTIVKLTLNPFLSHLLCIIDHPIFDLVFYYNMILRLDHDSNAYSRRARSVSCCEWFFLRYQKTSFDRHKKALC